jgi:hypothetical protein
MENSFEYGNKLKVKEKQGISTPTERMSVSQKGLFPMVLII